MSEPWPAEVADTQGAIVAMLCAVLDGDPAGFLAAANSAADPTHLVTALAGALLFALSEIHDGDLARVRAALAGWQPGHHLGECLTEH
jgi:hypothetical protein